MIINPGFLKYGLLLTSYESYNFGHKSWEANHHVSQKKDDVSDLLRDIEIYFKNQGYGFTKLHMTSILL